MHPWAWWCWALLIAAALNLTTHPLLLILLALAVTTVTLLRRSDAPWARSIGATFALAGVVIGIRMLFQIVIGAPIGSTVLFTLPALMLPDWAQGIRLGGPVTAEGLLLTVYDALRLATMLLCLGAANALANPRQALRSVPAALYEASVAVVIALSVAPQLIESGQRIAAARRLRGSRTTGLRALTGLLVPVMEDAVERSLALAAAMDARGFGRTVRVRHRRRLLALLLVSSMVLTLGGFLFLSGDTLVGLVGLVAGAAGTALGLRLTGRRLAITRYRPHPWGWRATAVALSGAAVLAVVVAMGQVDGTLLIPVVEPLGWPELHPAMLLAAALAAGPLLVTRPAAAPVPLPPATDEAPDAGRGNHARLRARPTLAVSA